MNEIYILVGKIIENIQQLEELLTFLPNLNFLNQFSQEISNNNLNKFNNVDKLTLGGKLTKIENLNILDVEDINVLKYIINKRNYLVHYFFTDNNFYSDIDLKIKELTDFHSELKLISTAIINLIRKSREEV